MNALSLFSGIGGIDIACEWAGFKTVAFCEWEKFPQQVLKKHWPGVPVYGDVRDLTKERLETDGVIGPGRTIELIHGGYPCQPFSLAGKREGTEDDRHLWPEVLRLIQALQPRWFVGENVAGHITLGLDIVLADLERCGYSWETFVLPACAVNALHRRDRVFIVAHANSLRDNSEGQCGIDRNRQKEMQERFESFLGFGYKSENVSYAASEGLPERRRSEWTPSTEETGAGMEPEFERCGEVVPDSLCKGLQGCEEARNFASSREETEQQFAGHHQKPVADADSNPEPQASATFGSFGSRREPWDDARWSGRGYEPGIDWWAVEPGLGGEVNGFSRELDGGGIDAKKARSIEIMRALRSGYDSEEFRGAIRRLNSIQKTEILLPILCELKEIGVNEAWLQLESAEAYERILRSLWKQDGTASTSHRSEQNEQRAREYTDALQVLSRFLAQYGPKTEEENRWSNAVPIFNAWGDGWEDGIPRVAAGVPNRVDRLKALGNAVVPQQIYPILAALKQIDDMLREERVTG